MTVLKSLLSTFRRSRSTAAVRRARRPSANRHAVAENLEQRLLLTNPDIFHSSPGAPVTIYLDFDGHTESDADWTDQIRNGSASPIVNPAYDLDGDPATYNQQERQRIEEIYLRVAEDFRPFNIDVTTELPASINNARDLLITVGGDGAWSVPASGLEPAPRFLALANSFSGSAPQSAFVFQTAHNGLGGEHEYNIAASISQAAAVAMGLQVHENPDDSRLEGDVDVAPILGDQIVGVDTTNSNVNSRRDLWFSAPGSGTANQDDLAILDGNPNVNYRTDDYGDTDATATGIAIGAGTETITGVIETNNDRDVFRFSTAATTATISIRGLDLTQAPFNAATPGSNLDPLLTLRDVNGNIVAFNDGPLLTSTITQFLPDGSYFIEVSNKSEYGNLGEYTITINGVDTLPPFANPVALNSKPDAPIDFYLSFAGGQLADTDPILTNRIDGATGPVDILAYDSDGIPGSYSAAEIDQIVEIYRRVAEDFAPFDVNITTVNPGPTVDGQSLEVLIGDGGAVFPSNAGYFASLGAFTDTTLPNTGITLSSNIQSGSATDGKNIAFQVSATIANMLGVDSHPEYAPDGSQQNPFDPGTAEVGPITGAPFSSLRDIWVNAPGPVNDATFQDDIALITDPTLTGIVVRADDHPNTIGTAKSIAIGIGDELIPGIIESVDDVDVFRIDTLATTATFSVKGLDLNAEFGVPNPGSNLDPVLELFDSSGNFVAISDIPFNVVTGNLALTASITQDLDAGTYFIRVSNRAEYGNLGQYTLTIQGVDAVPVTLTVDPGTFSEIDGLQVGVGRVNRPAGQQFGAAIVVDLESSDTSELTVPPQVIIPSGAVSATFDITIQDDDLLDFDQRVAVRAVVGSTINSQAFVIVTDHETIDLTVDPSPVAENSGVATLTVTRSNTDVDAPNHFVTANNQLLEYSPEGVLLNTIPVPWPSGGLRPPAEDVHDLVVLQNGQIAVYNGTANATLSIYNPNTLTWQHFGPVSGLSGLSADPTAGGLASFGDYVFLSDSETTAGDSHGMVRVDLITGEVTRFGGETFGARLFALESGLSSTVHEINPATGGIINTFVLPPILGTTGAPYLGESLTFDGTNLWVHVRFGSSGFDEIIKLDPNTGELLDSFSLASSQFFFGIGGIAYLDGLIYAKEDFSINSDFEVFDPALRTVLPGIRQVNNQSIFAVFLDDYIGALPGTGNLLMVDFGLSDTVYEVDASNGTIVSQFTPGDSLRFNPGITSVSDVRFGDTVYNDLIYVAASSNEISVYTRSGQQVDTDPSTAIIDRLQVGAFFTGDLGGADVPGVTSLDLSFRDVTVGFDGLVYGLTESGDEISIHDPESLLRVGGINLDQVVQAISVGDSSGIYAGTSNGSLVQFDFTGVTQSTLATTLGVIADIEVNVGQEVIVSDAGGNVLLTNQTAIIAGDTSGLTILENAGTAAFVTFGRHPTRSTGDLVVDLQSSDLTEIRLPDSVTIPEGERSVTVTVEVLDDQERDGDQTVTITANNPEYVPSSTDVIVTDVETIAVDVIPDSVSEDAGVVSDAIRIVRSDVDGPFEAVLNQSGSNTQPTAIIDDDVTISQISFPSQVSKITDIDVTLSIQHTAIPDLDVYLISPSGTRVELFTDLSSNASNLTGTILDDEAATRIVDGTAPYTGRFVPERPLSTFDGENPSGVWSLEVIDDNVTDKGTLLNWSIQMTTIGLSAATVTISSSDTTAATVQTTVTIPVNQAEVLIPLTAVTDDVLDGTQTTTISVDAINVTGLIRVPDNVDVADAETLQVSIAPGTISEGAGDDAAVGTITRTDTGSGAVVITLASSDTTELTVPGSVIIPAGQSSVNFTINAVDDFEFDGTQEVFVTASATGYLSADSNLIDVTDQEPRLQMSTLSPNVSEDAGSITITLARLDADDLTVEQSVSLTSSDLTELTVPATVVIPAGEISTSFDATILGDTLLDGSQTVTISAQDSNTANPVINSTSLDVTVEDAEAVSITADIVQFAENAGAGVATATVSVSAAGHTAPLFIALANSDISEISIPKTVIIPVGETSATFLIDAVDDPIIDLNQIVNVTGTLAGFLPGTLTLTVTDHEPPITTGPSLTTQDSTPTISWAPVDGATRYDLWVNDVSRNITQLFRNENEQAKPVLFSDDFESGEFATDKWVSNPGAEIDSLGLNDPNGTLSAHFNGSTDGVDRLQSVPMDFSGKVGVQLTYTFQQTGQGTSPELGNDLVLSYRNAAGDWLQLSRQLGSGPDMDQFRTVVVQLPEEALHSNFALRIESFGPVDDGDPDTPLLVADWFVDSVKFAEFETFTPVQKLGVGRYRFWVRAYDELEQPTAWSRGRDFLIRTSPLIVSPGDQKFVAAESFPEITWTSVVDTARYDLWVNNVTTGQSQVVRETNLQTTSFASELATLQGGTYRAWVRAIGPDGLTGTWSAGSTFTVLSAPTNVGPSGTTFDRTPELRWDAVTGADSYYVWLSKRNPGAASEVILRDRFVTNTFRVPDSDLEDGKYALWVQAIAQDGTASSWSPATEFIVGGRPEVVLPANDTVVSARPTFLWTGITGTDVYEVWVNRVDVPQTRIVYNDSVEVASFTVANALPAGTYRLWVRAISEMGEASFWSRPVNFTVASVEQQDSSLQIQPSTITASISAPAAVVFAETPRFESVMSDDTAEQTISPALVEHSTQEAAIQTPVVDADAVVDLVMAELSVADWWTESTGEQLPTEKSEAPLAGAAVGFMASGAVLRGSGRRKKRS